MLIYDIKGEGLHATDSDRNEQCPPTPATVTDIVIMQRQLRTRLPANNNLLPIDMR